MNKTKGKVVIVSGPSGVGKSTICKEVTKRLNNTYLSVSCTTRPRSNAEVNGRDYWFISEDEFRQHIARGLFLEYAEVYGHLYGTPKDKVDQALHSGRSIILEIDVQGAKQVQGIYKDAVMIFIFPPSQKELAERMKSRGRNDTQSAEERLEGASEEIAAAWRYYKYMVINEYLQQAVNEVIEIIRQSRKISHETDKVI